MTSRQANPELLRLASILATLQRQSVLLQDVAQRLFAEHAMFDADWLAATLASPLGIDRMESFGAKFGRMQDTLIAKAIPAFLRAVAEPAGSVLDNLNRAEALGIIERALDWLDVRGLRNRLVHEYVAGAEVMLASLELARRFVPVMQRTLAELQRRAADIPGWPPENSRPDIGGN